MLDIFKFECISILYLQINKDFLLSYECILCLEFCGSGDRTQVLTHIMHSTTELHSQLNI